METARIETFYSSMFFQFGFGLELSFWETLIIFSATWNSFSFHPMLSRVLPLIFFWPNKLQIIVYCWHKCHVLSPTEKNLFFSVSPFLVFKFLAPANFITQSRSLTLASKRGEMQARSNTLRLQERDQCWKLSLINNMILIIGVFNC